MHKRMQDKRTQHKRIHVHAIAALVVAAATALAPAVGAAADENKVTISVAAKAGKPVGGVQVYKLKRDDDVTLTVVADRADQLHVHGYEIERELAADQPQTVKFIAKRTGRFSVELHKSGATLAVLEIYPN